MKITLCTLLPLVVAASAMAATSEGTGDNAKTPATKTPIGDKAGDAKKAKLPKGGNGKAPQTPERVGFPEPVPVLDPNNPIYTLSKLKFQDGAMPADMKDSWNSLCESATDLAVPDIPAESKTRINIFQRDGKDWYGTCAVWYADAYGNYWLQYATDMITKNLRLDVVSNIKVDANGNAQK